MASVPISDESIQAPSSPYYRIRPHTYHSFKPSRPVAVSSNYNAHRDSCPAQRQNEQPSLLCDMRRLIAGEYYYCDTAEREEGRTLSGPSEDTILIQVASVDVRQGRVRVRPCYKVRATPRGAESKFHDYTRSESTSPVVEVHSETFTVPSSALLRTPRPCVLDALQVRDTFVDAYGCFDSKWMSI